MGRYLLRRLGFALLLVLIVSSASLLLTRLAPGDFVADQALALNPEALAKLRADLGLDRPLVVQYVAWLGGVVQLDFGRSLLYSRPVSTLIGERALNTAVLAVVALALATLIGLPLGVYSGSRSRGVGRSAIRALSIVALSVPPVLAAASFAAASLEPEDDDDVDGRLSVLYQPEPLKTIAGSAISRRGRSPQTGQCSTGGSSNERTTLNAWPQWSQRWS